MKDLSKFLRNSIAIGTVLTGLAVASNYASYNNAQSHLTNSPKMTIDNYETGIRKMPKQTADLITDILPENKKTDNLINEFFYGVFKTAEFTSRPGREMAYQKIKNPEIKNPLLTYIASRSQQLTPHLSYFQSRKP